MKKSILALLALLLICSCQTKNSSNISSDSKLTFLKWAPTPPMGWNSWDCYGPTVVESEVKANADYMAANLKKFGWEYVVIDIRWYIENDKAGGYNESDARYVMDSNGRYQPAVNRFPSSADGKGFKPIGDYIHSKGLKFGIHIMRGIPVLAVKQNLPVLGSNVKAQDIYSPDGQCRWLKDNYTVDSKKEGAQAYYNSLFQLYASWGIDFVKVDDLAGRLPEIEMVRKAIDNSGRPIVLSISPGPAQIEQADFLKVNANMWRTVDDFWDNWPQLKPQFATCAAWAPHIATGHFPDADMLPLGKIGLRAERGAPRMTGFTKDEQYTVMSLFSIFRSPLMFGGDLPSNDDFTLALITNKDVLNVNQNSTNNKQLFRNDDQIAWTADDPKTGNKYLALFNASDQKPIVESKAIWKSEQITQDTPDQSVDIDIDIIGAKKLYLVATYNEGPRFDSHNCNWIEPKLFIGKKSKNLTDLKWVKATSGRGEPAVNKTTGGGKLTIDGKEYKTGINVNATSIIEYDLPEGVTRFKAKAGLQNEVATGMGSGTNFPGKRNSRAKFMIFTEDPAGPVPDNATEISVKFEQLGLTGTHKVKDLWSGKNLGKFTDEFKQTINRHGAGLFRIY